MCDKLVFDLAQEVEGSPSVFVRKDWINILDNQTQNYTSNQSVLDTSQLSNSNKYMSYRESYFLFPLTLTLASGDFKSDGLGAVTPSNFGGSAAAFQWKPATTDYSDSAIGLKNWFGNIIHSFTLDYNGSTIIQQTPFVNMWNSFKLMTSLSYNDIMTQGATIGFYPDDAQSFEYYLPYAPQVVGNSSANPPIVATANPLITPVAGAAGTYNIYNGVGICNNTNQVSLQNNLSSGFQQFNSGNGNIGFINRQKWISYDQDGIAGKASDLSPSSVAQKYSGLLNSAGCEQLWKSYLARKQDQVVDGATFIQSKCGLLQYNIVATIYLKHIHSFFNMCPLLKGVFMKMTMNLNNCSSSVYIGTNTLIAGGTTTGAVGTAYSVPSSASSALGGVNMCQIAAISSNNGGVSNVVTAASLAGIKAINPPLAPGLAAGFVTVQAGAPAAAYNVQVQGTGIPVSGLALASVSNMNLNNGATNLLKLPQNNTLTTTAVVPAAPAGLPAWLAKQYLMNLSVGANCLDSNITSLAGYVAGNNNACKSIYLYIPAYTFNPPFEQAYISSPVKSIKYTDIYQYQVLNVSSGTGQFNNLLTNGIANIKSVLILPFFSSAATPSGFSQVYKGCPQFTAAAGGFLANIPVWQSPYDTAGTGTTSPLCHFTNFNVQVSGQNAIYNLQLRAFEQFNNQLYGQNAVNGGLTDGITSSLIDRMSFDMNYCYYYVNVERMLPVEQSVPKSIQIVGTNASAQQVDLMCFVEYGTEVSIDVLTGARV
jgi:hypothetical protein